MVARETEVPFALVPNTFGPVLLESNSFNAQKRSGFTVDGATENIERGLTIVHFNTSKGYEYKTFDTHTNEEEAAQFMLVLKNMTSDKAYFAILAHDSAANMMLKYAEEIKSMGYVQLSTLKSRQAYAMHNFKGTVVEMTHDTTVKINVTIPLTNALAKVYFPKVKYTFEPSIDRYIAHAGGEVDGIASTNTKNALDQNYAKGFRLFELDIIETSDAQLVAAHDWGMWARFTEYPGQLPPSHAEFMKYKIYGKYATLDMNGINAWFKAHPDAVLVTDKVNDPLAFANAFVDKSRLYMELFSVMAIEEASKNGIKAMISQEPLMALKGDKLNWLKVNNVKLVALSRRIVASQTKLLLDLKEAGVKVYVYNVGFDPGKDEKFVQENELGLVYGMYADKWVFEGVRQKTSK